jgi:hypothetical protein
MMKTLLTISACLIFNAMLAQPVTGKYTGLEEMWCTINKQGKKTCYKDPEHPKHKWFRLSVISFEGDSVFLDQSPVAIYKTDTIYSASDGGFYYYKGTYKVVKDTLRLNFKLDHCDYCALPKNPKPGYGVKNMVATRKEKAFSINGYVFTRSE